MIIQKKSLHKRGALKYIHSVHYLKRTKIILKGYSLFFLPPDVKNHSPTPIPNVEDFLGRFFTKNKLEPHTLVNKKFRYPRLDHLAPSPEPEYWGLMTSPLMQLIT
jgi:hypothetical protein